MLWVLLAAIPFLTSYLIRVTAWVYPVMGSEGAINQVLTKKEISNVIDNVYRHCGTTPT